MRRLAELPHDTDKSSYLPDYERYFHSLTDSPIVLLELGVGTGASLLLWRDYFRQARVIGLDENEIFLADESGRIKVYQGDQAALEVLERLAAENAPGGFDIIIDDCSHIGDKTRKSFWYLFEHHLKPGGVYAIEEWGTGYWPAWPDGAPYEPRHAHGMVGFIKELVDELGAEDITHPEHGVGATRGSRIGRLEILPGLALVTKR
jgi:SAM-dependent methyltransferase